MLYSLVLKVHKQVLEARHRNVRYDNSSRKNPDYTWLELFVLFWIISFILIMVYSYFIWWKFGEWIKLTFIVTTLFCSKVFSCTNGIRQRSKETSKHFHQDDWSARTDSIKSIYLSLKGKNTKHFGIEICKRERGRWKLNSTFKLVTELLGDNSGKPGIGKLK